MVARGLGTALGLILALAAPVAAQDFQFSDPATTAWAGRVRDRLATRDSLEAVYSRANARLRADQSELYSIQAARPAYGESVQAFQQRIMYRQQQLRSDMLQTQQLLVRSQQRLDPIYSALRKDYDYACAYPDPNVRQSVGSLIAAAGHGLDPIWIKTPPIVVPAAGASAAGVDAAATDAATADAAVQAAAGNNAAAMSAAANGANAGTSGTSAAGANDPAANAAGANASGANASGNAPDPMRDQTVANAIMQNGSARNVPPSDPAATVDGTAGAAASATHGAAPANTIWTMEADQASGTMMMHARDASTMQRVAGVDPVPTHINTGADATVAPEGAGQTLGSLRRTAWQAETNGAGETTFRAVDWRSHQPIENGPTLAAHGTPTTVAASTTGGAANQPTAQGDAAAGTTNAAGTAATDAAAAAALSPERLTSAVWTAEPNPSTNTMVLRARDAITNNHLAGVAPVETNMPIPPSGQAATEGAVTRSTFKDVTYTATHDPATNQLTFKPTSKSGAQLPSEVETVTSGIPAGTRAAGTRAAAPSETAGAASDTAATGEAAAGEAAAGKPGFQMPSMKAVASSAAKWGGLSIGVTLASNVAQSFMNNGGRVDWKQSTDFLTDSHFWGGTAGGFVGSMAGGALAAFVPGGAFVKAALSIGGAALGYQVGSGQLGKTDWVGLGVTTIGAAAGTALGATMGPVGALAGGIAGQMLSQFIYDKIKEARQGGPIAAPVPPGKGYPPSMPPIAYVPPAQLPPPAFKGGPVSQVGQIPSQFPGQMPTQQMPTQMPGQMPSQFPGQVPGQFPGQVPGQFPGQVPGQIPTGVSQLPVGQYQGGSYGSGLPSIPNQQLLAGPPGAGSYSGGGLTDLTARMNRVYQEKLLADQTGNGNLSYQKMLEYQQLRAQIEAQRRSAYQSGGYGDYRQSR